MIIRWCYIVFACLHWTRTLLGAPPPLYYPYDIPKLHTYPPKGPQPDPNLPFNQLSPDRQDTELKWLAVLDNAARQVAGVYPKYMKMQGRKIKSSAIKSPQEAYYAEHIARTVVVTVANMGYLSHLRNFACFAQRLRMHFLVLSVDDMLVAALSTSRHPYFTVVRYHGHYTSTVSTSLANATSQSPDLTKAAGFQSAQFNLISLRKFEAVYDLQRLGYDALFVDADVVLLQDVFPLLLRRHLTHVSYLHSMNQICAIRGEESQYFLLSTRTQPNDGNTGFHFLQHPPYAIHRLDHFYETSKYRLPTTSSADRNGNEVEEIVFGVPRPSTIASLSLSSDTKPMNSEEEQKAHEFYRSLLQVTETLPMVQTLYHFLRFIPHDNTFNPNGQFDDQTLFWRYLRALRWEQNHNVIKLHRIKEENSNQTAPRRHYQRYLRGRNDAQEETKWVLDSTMKNDEQEQLPQTRLEEDKNVSANNSSKAEDFEYDADVFDGVEEDHYYYSHQDTADTYVEDENFEYHDQDDATSNNIFTEYEYSDEGADEVQDLNAGEEQTKSASVQSFVAERHPYVHQPRQEGVRDSLINNPHAEIAPNDDSVDAAKASELIQVATENFNDMEENNDNRLNDLRSDSNSQPINAEEDEQNKNRDSGEEIMSIQDGNMETLVPVLSSSSSSTESATNKINRGETHQHRRDYRRFSTPVVPQFGANPHDEDNDIDQIPEDYNSADLNEAYLKEEEDVDALRAEDKVDNVAGNSYRKVQSQQQQQSHSQSHPHKNQNDDDNVLDGMFLLAVNNHPAPSSTHNDSINTTNTSSKRRNEYKRKRQRTRKLNQLQQQEQSQNSDKTHQRQLVGTYSPAKKNHYVHRPTKSASYTSHLPPPSNTINNNQISQNSNNHDNYNSNTGFAPPVTPQSPYQQQTAVSDVRAPAPKPMSTTSMTRPYSSEKARSANHYHAHANALLQQQQQTQQSQGNSLLPPVIPPPRTHNPPHQITNPTEPQSQPQSTKLDRLARKKSYRAIYNQNNHNTFGSGVNNDNSNNINDNNNMHNVPPLSSVTEQQLETHQSNKEKASSHSPFSISTLLNGIVPTKSSSSSSFRSGKAPNSPASTQFMSPPTPRHHHHMHPHHAHMKLMTATRDMFGEYLLLSSTGTCAATHARHYPRVKETSTENMITNATTATNTTSANATVASPNSPEEDSRDPWFYPSHGETAVEICALNNCQVAPASFLYFQDLVKNTLKRMKHEMPHLSLPHVVDKPPPAAHHQPHKPTPQQTKTNDPTLTPHTIHELLHLHHQQESNETNMRHLPKPSPLSANKRVNLTRYYSPVDTRRRSLSTVNIGNGNGNSNGTFAPYDLPPTIETYLSHILSYSTGAVPQPAEVVDASNDAMSPNNIAHTTSGHPHHRKSDLTRSYWYALHGNYVTGEQEKWMLMQQAGFWLVPNDTLASHVDFTQCLLFPHAIAQTAASINNNASP